MTAVNQPPPEQFSEGDYNVLVISAAVTSTNLSRFYELTPRTAGKLVLQRTVSVPAAQLAAGDLNLPAGGQEYIRRLASIPDDVRLKTDATRDLQEALQWSLDELIAHERE